MPIILPILQSFAHLGDTFFRFGHRVIGTWLEKAMSPVETNFLDPHLRCALVGRKRGIRGEIGPGTDKKSVSQNTPK